MDSRTYPALDVRGAAEPDLVLAAVDDLSPTAVEERDDSVRVFFSTKTVRDEAQSILAAHFDVTPIEIPDEDWARRSQETLQAVTVGRVTIAPPWSTFRTIRRDDRPHYTCNALRPPAPSLHPVTIVIEPSMGFGTGHHATTRLCLAALQTIDLDGTFVLDVGTGSGVLAIAARRLGATRALGIDCDADAIRSARDNLALNPDVHDVEFRVGDLNATPLPVADIVIANLTGALLVREANRLAAAVRASGALVLSGLQTHERDDVCGGFAGMAVGWESEEDGWVGVMLRGVSR